MRCTTYVRRNDSASLPLNARDTSALTPERFQSEGSKGNTGTAARKLFQPMDASSLGTVLRPSVFVVAFIFVGIMIMQNGKNVNDFNGKHNFFSKPCDPALKIYLGDLAHDHTFADEDLRLGTDLARARRHDETDLRRHVHIHRMQRLI